MIVERWWLEFEQAVIPKAASEVQRSEMRKTFYAGVNAFIRASVARFDDGRQPTLADMQWMDAVNAELDAFAAEVKGCART